MSQKIAIIGCHSFTGSHIVHGALSQGFDVLGLSNSPKTSIPFTPYHWKKGNGHRFALEQLDPNIALDNEIKSINDYQPDYIINCADEGSIKIHRKFDTTPSLLSFQAAHVYGPAQQVHEVIPKIILSILLEKKIPLHHERCMTHSFIHIDDLVASLFKILREGTSEKNYYLSSSRLILACELVTLICKRMEIPFEDAVSLIEERSNKESACSLDHESFLKNSHEPHWQPTIELEKGIDSVVAWAQEWLPALKNHVVDLQN